MKAINKLISFDDISKSKIYERNFSVDHQQKFESIFCVGNGYLGIRSSHEEYYDNQYRGFYVQGTFQTANKSEISELPNFPDIIGSTIILDDEQLDLTRGKLSNYSRELNLENGVHTRSFDWEINGKKYHFEFQRFVSFSEKHLIANRITILPSQSGQLSIHSGINGQTTNHGAQHFDDGRKRVFPDKSIAYQFSGLDNDLDAVIFQTSQINDCEADIDVGFGRRQINRTINSPLKTGITTTVTSYSAIATSRDPDMLYKDKESLLNFVIKVGMNSSQQTYEDIKSVSQKAWQERVWDQAPVVIESTNPFDSLMLNFGRYHLHIMTSENDDTVNIAAKGLSGEGYKGHVFWDTDIFIVPYFQFNYPKIARNLMDYRYSQLSAARVNAANNGFLGAQYPWESTTIEGGETTPLWGDINVDTGEPTRIWTGQIEAHITADVAYTMLKYCNGLEDSDTYLYTRALPVLFDTARFWSSRVKYIEGKQRYEINDVIGPNEYKEHIDNNAYTNYLAYYNMKMANEFIEIIKQYPAKYQKYNQQLQLDNLQKKLKNILKSLYLPRLNNNNILPENDSFLSLKNFDKSQYTGQQVGDVLKDFSMNTLNQYQVCKQADIVLLLLMFPHKFDAAVRAKNIDYYEERTMHDSSLSYGTHAVAYARNGSIKNAYNFYHLAGLIDLGPNPSSSADGVHAAAMAQIWNIVISGFAGLDSKDGILQLSPHLPDEWRSLQFGIHWQGQNITVNVKNGKVLIKTDNSISIKCEVYGKQINLTKSYITDYQS